MRIADGINEAFDAAEPWLLAKDATRRDELQTVCSKALQGFQLLSVILAPVLPAVASRVARELFGLDRDFVWSDAWEQPASIRPYKHLMERIDPKQVDALLEGPEPVSCRRRLRGCGLVPRQIADRRLLPRSTCVSRRSSTPSTSPAPTSCSS